MMSEPLFYGTQYNDFLGKVAVDGHDGTCLSELAKVANVPDTHWVIGFTLDEFDPDDSPAMPITVIAVQKSVAGNKSSEVHDYQRRTGGLQAERFEGHLSAQDFFRLFKRVSIVAVQKGYDIDTIEVS